MNHFKLFALVPMLASVLSACDKTHAVTPDTAESRLLHVVELQDPLHSSRKHFSGIVHSKESAGLAFRVPGTIEELLVIKGESVSKGQLIAKLDPHDYQVVLEELEAKKLEAVSAHKLANAELARVRQATDDDAIAQVSLDRAISGYERSLSAIKVIDKNIQRAEDALSYTQLKAPFDGVVGSVDFEQYEQVLPGLPVINLQQNALMEVEIDVPENLIEQFSIGHSASVSWHQSAQKVNATVTEVSPLPHRFKQTYTVTLALDNSEQSLFPGKAVTVSTYLGQVNDAFCLPYHAVIGDNSALYVNVVRHNTVLPVAVEMRSLDAAEACVSGDLNVGDYAVISGSNYLKSGAAVSKLEVITQ